MISQLIDINTDEVFLQVADKDSQGTILRLCNRFQHWHQCAMCCILQLGGSHGDLLKLGSVWSLTLGFHYVTAGKLVRIASTM